MNDIFEINNSIRANNRRLLMLTFGGFILIASYFIITDHRSYLEESKAETLKKLESVAKTLSLRLSGDMHEYLTQKFRKKDAIKTSEQDSVYQHLHSILKATHDINHFDSDIYTLFMEDEVNVKFGVTSGTTPYYRHPYLIHPEELLEKFEMGGAFADYKSENGHWLSAFAPILNSKGKVVAVVEVDQRFDNFITKANRTRFLNIGISASVIILVGIGLFFFIQNILRQAEKLVKELAESKEIIEKKNRNINNSVNYAKRITEATLPTLKEIQQHFPESFVLFKPRDIVSGDFYWFYALKDNRFLVGVFDCTGHGVPGAILSMMGHSLLDELILQVNEYEPNRLLFHLNQRIIQTLKQNNGDKGTQDGMEACLCLIDYNENKIHFAGANRPLYIIHQEELHEIKPTKMPLGGTFYPIERTFELQTLPFQSKDRIYLTSDGFADQFGLFKKEERKFMTKNLKKLITQNQHLALDKQGEIFENRFCEWRGNLPQVDDVTLLGLEL